MYNLHTIQSYDSPVAYTPYRTFLSACRVCTEEASRKIKKKRREKSKQPETIFSWWAANLER